MSRGMTLVEVMVALALLSLLAVGIVTSFRLGERSYRQLVSAASSDRDVLSAQRFLRQTLESVHPLHQPRGARVMAYGLEGSSRQLTVTAPMPQGIGRSGNARYEFVVERDGPGGSSNLVVRWSLDRNGTAGSMESGGDAHNEVLLEGIESVEWAYWAPRQPPFPAVSAEETRWSSSWTQSSKPPALVRLRVRFPPGDRRQWPELLVAPRVTDDPHCQFDIVAQACRES